METGSDRHIQVVPLGEDRADEAAALMARAFKDDPWAVHSCPDPGERTRWLPWVFRPNAWQGCLFGELRGTAGRLDGVAAAVSPTGGEFTEEDLARFAYGHGREAIGAEAWDRIMAPARAAYRPAAAVLHQAVPEPHWYLDVIAVEADQQGRGIGSALLEAIHARVDAGNVPILLLTYQPKSLSLYRRHGYRIVCEGTAPGCGPRWWGMRRDPRS